MFEGRLQKGEVLTRELEFGEDGKPTTLAFELKAAGMNNSWAFAALAAKGRCPIPS